MVIRGKLNGSVTSCTTDDIFYVLFICMKLPEKSNASLFHFSM